MCPRVDKAVGWGISRGYGGGVKGLLGIWLGMTCGLPVRCAEAISGLNCGGNGAGNRWAGIGVGFAMPMQLVLRMR